MSNPVDVRFITPTTMPKSVGYSQIATVHSGQIVFIAGQVALDAAGNLVGKDNFREQVEQVFKNLNAALSASGGNFRDVVKLSSYFLDISRLSEFREVRDRYIDVNSPPTSTAVQVSKLFRPEFLIEIEAVAVTKKL